MWFWKLSVLLVDHSGFIWGSNGFPVLLAVQVYLVDYGLAYRYAPDGVLKEYKEDPKKCHDGTIEFTSIDAHKGVGAYESALKLRSTY